jgi:hypothetical protein
MLPEADLSLGERFPASRPFQAVTRERLRHAISVDGHRCSQWYLNIWQRHWKSRMGTTTIASTEKTHEK